MVDEFEFDHEDDEESGRGGRIPDSIRKAVVGGLSALMMTEEGIRNALGDMRMPKEALSYLAQQGDKTRKELFRAVSDEIKGFLKGIDLTGELRKALTGLRVQVKAEVTFLDANGTDTKLETSVEDIDEPEEKVKPEAKARKKRRKKTARKS